MRLNLKPAGIVAAMAVACGTFASPAAGAVLGPTNLAATAGAFTCLESTCTVATPRLPGARVRSQFRGEIVRWKVNVPEPHDLFVNDGPFRLQVLKRTDNQPGHASDQYQAVRESAAEAATPGEVNVFDTSLVIRKDQYIGITGTDDSEISHGNEDGAVFLRWDGALVPGADGLAPQYAFDDTYALFNARVVR